MASPSQDPDAGPLDPAWDLTLSVAAGTLTLSSTAGLTGSGRRDRSLSYQRPALGAERGAGRTDVRCRRRGSMATPR